MCGGRRLGAATSYLHSVLGRSKRKKAGLDMGDSVQYALDRMVADLEDLRYRGIFSEVKSAAGLPRDEVHSGYPFTAVTSARLAETRR